MKSIAYLCFQATREGQASYAHVHEIINGLKKRGWNVDLFEPSYVVTTSDPSILKRLAEFVRIQVKLVTKITRYDCLYVRMHYIIFPSVYAANLFGIPVVIEVNGQDDDLYIVWPATRYFEKFIKWMLYKSFQKADALIAVTSQLKSWVTSIVAEKRVYVIPNAANSRLFNPRARLTYNVNKPYVIFFGTLTLWQGIDVLIDSVKLPEWPSELNLLIAGDGIERITVERAAEDADNIDYLSFIPYTELPGVIVNSIASICPKNNLGDRVKTGLSPLKVFESLACGVPVIVTNFPGQADLVREYRCGLVIPHDDPVKLAEAVLYLYKNKKERELMGARGRELIVNEHNWVSRAIDTEKVLIELIQGTSGI